MKLRLTAIITLVLVSVPVLVLAQQAAAPAPSPPQYPPCTEGKGDPAMMERCKEWQARHEKMMAEMKAMDARLDERLAAMNAAKGDQKVEAMAAVINELVSQRKAMRADFGPMPPWRKGPMMGQQAGMPPDCPMMKNYGDTQPDRPKKEGTP